MAITVQEVRVGSTTDAGYRRREAGAGRILGRDYGLRGSYAPFMKGLYLLSEA